MEQRLLEVTVLSAKDLNKVNLIAKMDVYIIISISDDKLNQTVKTPVDKYSGSNPYWNFKTSFIIDKASAHQNIVFNLKCVGLFEDKDIGEVRIPINELLKSPEAIDGKKQIVNYQVRKPDGKSKGFIKFAYQYEKTVKQAEEPPTIVFPPPHGIGSSSSTPPSAPPVYPLPEGGYPHILDSGEYPAPSKHSEVGYYPPPPHPGGYPPPPKFSEGGYYPPPPHSVGGYPPPPKYSEGGYYIYYPPQSHFHSGGGYPPPPSYYHGAPPPQGGYPHFPQYAGYDYQHPPPYGGYPPPPRQPGYGYAQGMQKPPKKNSKDGLGSEAGLIGGAVGGLLIGDMISDGGFGDVGFDF